MLGILARSFVLSLPSHSIRYRPQAPKSGPIGEVDIDPTLLRQMPDWERR